MTAQPAPQPRQPNGRWAEKSHAAPNLRLAPAGVDRETSKPPAWPSTDEDHAEFDAWVTAGSPAPEVRDGGSIDLPDDEPPF